MMHTSFADSIKAHGSKHVHKLWTHLNNSPVQRDEIELFCQDAAYESRFVPSGFVPKTEEDRLSLVPPELNRDTNSWSESKNGSEKENDNIDEIRKRLEGLL